MAATAKQIADYFIAHPETSMSTEEGVKMFGGSPHTLRQAMYEARKRGVSIRCVRVYRLRRQP